MSNQQKTFFGIKTNIGWFDIKTKAKHMVRSIFYNKLMQEIISTIIFLYIKLVFYSSKKTLLHHDRLINMIRNNQSAILAFWHSRIMMVPLMTKSYKKINQNYRFYALTSRHGDGQYVRNVLRKLYVNNIYGSSVRGRQGRGINLSSFKKIFTVLKSNNAFVITPDGPKGPKQKINGQLVNIASNTGVPIIPYSCSISKYKKLRTWDEFIFPLPFSKICYHFGEPILIKKNITDNEIEKLNLLLEEKINYSMEECEKITKG